MVNVKPHDARARTSERHTFRDRVVGKTLAVKNCSPVVRSEQIQTCVLIGVAFVFNLMASGLGISWLTGGEIHRSEFLMVGAGLVLIGSLLWIRYAQRPRGEKRPAAFHTAGSLRIVWAGPFLPLARLRQAGDHGGRPPGRRDNRPVAPRSRAAGCAGNRWRFI